jgi:hypothetical protein
MQTHTYTQRAFSVHWLQSLLVENRDCLEIFQTGDGATAIVREGCMVFMTEPILEGYNSPSCFDKSTMIENKHAELYSIPIKQGDIVIAASDGITDNVFPRQPEKMIESADAIMKFATEKISGVIDSEERGYTYNRLDGKIDDLSLIIQRI